MPASSFFRTSFFWNSGLEKKRGVLEYRKPRVVPLQIRIGRERNVH
jgi:hypothetical protein